MAALALAEVTVRILDPHARDHALPAEFFTMDASLGWRLRPARTARHRTRYFDVSYATNARGFRDNRHADPKQPGRARVLIFGDSQVFGWGIPHGRRFTDLVAAAHPELDIWNLGVTGYGLDQELLAYERDGATWDPDVVVLFASRFTIARTQVGRVYHKDKPRFVLDSLNGLRLVPPAPGAVELTELVYRMLSTWYLPYFLERRLAIAGAVRPTEELSELPRALVARAAAVARARGDTLIVLADLPATTFAALRDVGEREGIEVVSAGIPADRDSFVLGPMDRHWNERGHEVVARALAERWAHR